VKYARVFRKKEVLPVMMRLPTVPGTYVCSEDGVFAPPTQAQLDKENEPDAYDEYDIATRYIFDGRGWRVHDISVAHHGFTVKDKNGVTLVFLEMLDPPASDFDEGLATRPEDGDHVRIWTDWLLERGHRLGDFLASGQLHFGALEGLAPVINEGLLTIAVKHGLIRRAALSQCDVPFPARLVSLPIARWMQHLTFDGAELDVDMLMAVLVQGPPLIALESLCLGYTRPQRIEMSSFKRAYDELRKRAPRLAASPTMLRPVTRAELRVSRVPENIRFKSPIALQNRIALNRGVWVGRPQNDLLIAVDADRAPNLAIGSFEIQPQSSTRDTSPRWVIQARGNSIFINGASLTATPRYLRDGDQIEDATGARFDVVVE
jgi:hypothetical protein